MFLLVVLFEIPESSVSYLCSNFLLSPCLLFNLVTMSVCWNKNKKVFPKSHKMTAWCPLETNSANSTGRQDSWVAIWNQNLTGFHNTKEALSLLNWLYEFQSPGKSLLSQSSERCLAMLSWVNFLANTHSRLLGNNYLRASLKTVLFFNPISVKITAWLQDDLSLNTDLLLHYRTFPLS